jgi:hypothetical protein
MLLLFMFIPAAILRQPVGVILWVQARMLQEQASSVPAAQPVLSSAQPSPCSSPYCVHRNDLSQFSSIPVTEL